MAVTVPTCFEANLTLEDGSTGFSLPQALKLEEKSVPNLYSVPLTVGGNVFTFDFKEKGVAYNETEATVAGAKASFEVQGGSEGFTLTVEPTPVVMWGINYAGRVKVKHDSGSERIIYLPGTRTYDPAGMTGDPHASERIGPSCSRTQIAVTLAELVAVKNGAENSQIDSIQQVMLPLIKRYHGRVCLFAWMKLQIEEAVFKNQDVTPYPEFVKAQIREGKLEINDAREHTRVYLNSYNHGQAHPPIQYYQKVSKKDKVTEIFSAEDLAKFQDILKLSI